MTNVLDVFKMTSLGIAFSAILVFSSGHSFGEESEASKVRIAPTPEIVSVMNFEKAEKQEFPWGWIRWVMNSEIDKDATMTYGLVQIDAGKSNPLHLHPNCEEYLYVLSGSCEHVIGDKTVMLKEGDVIRIPQSVPHKATAGKDAPMKAVIVYNSGERKIVILEEGGQE